MTLLVVSLYHNIFVFHSVSPPGSDSSASGNRRRFAGVGSGSTL